MSSVFKESFNDGRVENKFHSSDPKNANKQSNFQLSSSNTFFKETVNSTFYQGGTQQDSPTNPSTLTQKKLRDDLRREHFNFGSGKTEM
mmetsp:Transcript_30090/g.22351  ORF Transcript_30090/g.22351 Transcript_30090/m.22351 type:complete len:89 (-) Transcript_30090:633-899(-)